MNKNMMNTNMVWMQELELIQRSLAIWGKISPQLFTFDGRTDKGMVHHG